MDFIALIQFLNKELKAEYKFNLNPIYSTHAIVKEGVNVEFLGYTKSISKDIHIVPSNLIPKIVLNKNTYLLLQWINTKLFETALNQLLQQKKLFKTSAEGVRMRIAVNMISKQSILTKEEQQEWIMQLQNVYYERKRVIDNFYFREIEGIPF